MSETKLCCIINCENYQPKDSKVNACQEHESMIIEAYEKEYEEYLQERWDDYNAMVRQGINAANMNRY